jgi:hypothetical protein
MTITDIEATVLVLRDLTTLPKGKYLLVIDGVIGNRGFVPVDKVTMDRLGNVHGYRAGGKKMDRVVVFPGGRSWFLVDTTYVETRSLKEFMVRAAEKATEYDTFQEELKKKYNLKEEPVGLLQPGEPQRGVGLYL